MKTMARYFSVALPYGLVLVLVCLTLCGCGPALVRVMKEDPRDNTRYLRLSSAELGGEATVYRGGRRLPVSLPYQLQPGDVIETGPDAVAVVRFPEGNEIILDSNTRVRLGSFFVEFGRILARVQGLFEAESENVTAGVEGTEFVFEVTRDRAVAVTVLDGTVVCRSKIRSWQVHLSQGEFFYSQHPNLVNPGKRSAMPKELDDIRRWIKKIEESTGQLKPETGYCCMRGELFQSTRENCKGRFFLDEAQARNACPSSIPEKLGYCCSGGRVYRTTAESCRGVFASTEAEAYRRCPDAQQGYCCRDGRVTETSRSGCAGSFFTDYDEAMKNCRPKPETGYCCMRGELFQSTRENCKGSFFRDEAEARKACRSIVPLPMPPIKPKLYEPYRPPVIK